MVAAMLYALEIAFYPESLPHLSLMAQQRASGARSHGLVAARIYIGLLRSAEDHEA
jgi:hypothetical protein